MRASGTPPAALAIIADEARCQSLTGQHLVLGIERGAHRKAAGIELLLAIDLLHFPAHLLGEGFGREQSRPHRTRRDLERHGRGLGMFGLADEAVFEHAVEHPVAALERALGMAIWMIVVGRLGQRGEIGHFDQAQLVEGLAEVVERRRGDAVGAEPEEDLVQIKFEDLVLGERLFDAKRQQRLLELAIHGAVAGQQEVLGHLLGDGRSANEAAVALDDVLPIDDDRPHQCAPVDARMLVERLVLSRQEGVDEPFGHRTDWHEQPSFAGVFADQRAIAGMDARHHRRLVPGELLVVGQRLGGFPDDVAGSHGKSAERHEAGSKQNP
jgi:hypothetical protein